MKASRNQRQLVDHPIIWYRPDDGQQAVTSFSGPLRNCPTSNQTKVATNHNQKQPQTFFSSGMADHALRLGPYMRISCYQENFNMDTGGRMRIGKS